jgi:hypothetical protein
MLVKVYFSKEKIFVYYYFSKMENFVFPYFTEQQKWIITKRYEGASYAAICREWPFKEIEETAKVGANLRKKSENVLYNTNIVMYIKRSSHGYAWSKSMHGETDVYLCPEDLNQLKQQSIVDL